MRKAFSWLWRWIRDEAVSQVFTSAWFWAFAATGVAAMTGLLQSLPILWVYLGSLSALAIVFVLLAANSVRRSLSSPKFKIVVETMNPSHWPDGQMQKIKLYLIFKNLGNFPIEVDCSQVDWSMDGLGGVEKKDVQQTAIVPPVGQQILHGPIFNRILVVPTNDESKAVKIKVCVDVTYGVPGNLKYVHRQDYTLNCWIDPGDRSNDSVWIEQNGKGRFA
ncbi:MAG: hypothetical protein ABJL57_07550 [Hyphomonas sp.]|uniref:hypothetical protein n=1 Tax=Alphaproteobacteria TaxID=28211 RepID=UPI003264372D